MSCPAHALAASRRMIVKEDVDCIRELVSRFPKDKDVVVVDLGTGSGTTALSVFAERGNRVHIYGFDNSDEGHWGEKAVGNIGRAKDFTLLRKSVTDLEGWPDLEVDLLLLDASHEYNGVKRGLEVWLPHMAEEGLIWIHDYGDPSEYGLPADGSPGVRRAVDEVVQSGAMEKDFPHRDQEEGLGWVGRKPSTVPSMSKEEPERQPLPFTGGIVKGDLPTSANVKAKTVDVGSNPPCPGCGFLPPSDKDYAKSMASHKRQCEDLLRR